MSLPHRIIGLLVAFAVAACGGGGDMVARIGSGGSGAPVSVAVGAVGGYGSIIVNGQHYDETAAQVSIDERPDQATAASIDALRLGSQVQLEHQANRISKATVAAEVIGPVTSVSASSLVVLGQTVRVNADPAVPTVFDGFAALTDLTAGTRLEVHGQRNAAGEILATRIEVRPAAGVLRVAGVVANLGSSGFSIGALTIRTSQATIVPAGQSLANGQRVVAWTDLALSGGEMVARVVRIGGLPIVSDAALTVDGIVTDFQSAANFRVAGIAVDASGAQFVGGVAADLRNGRLIRASGTFASGVLRASRVEILAATAAVIELSGAISGYVDAASAFRIRTAAARVTPQTTYLRGDVTNLGNGVLVKATGPLVNGVVEAVTVDFLPPSAGIARVLFGTVANLSALAADGSRTFRLSPQPFDVKTTTATRYKNGVAADLAAGRAVKVDGVYDGTNFVADELQFMDNVQSPPTFSIDGIATNVQPTEVTVDGKDVMLTTATVYTKNGVAATIAELKNGSQVAITAVKLNGVFYASTVEIKELASGEVSVRGLVSGRASAAALEFLVGSQRVSVAGNPKVIPGNKTLADIVNGTDLEVDGTIAAGLLTATRVKFR
jgi:hypothetical protein